MPRAIRVPSSCVLLLSVFISGACTRLVEDRLGDGPSVHCSEHNLHLTRELELPVCATVVGEHFSVQLEEFVPETIAVVSFAPVESPQSILQAVEVEVSSPGVVTFGIPDLPAAAGSRLRIQIQGKNTLNAFSGHFEIALLSTLAGLAPNGDVNLWFWNGTDGPQWQGRIPSTHEESGQNELRFSPCGRFMAAGARTVGGSQGRFSGDIEPVDLDLIAGLERRLVQRFESTGGIDSLGFLPVTNLDKAHPVWARHDVQTGQWRLVAGAFDGLSPGPTVFVGGIPGFAVPPRLVSGFDTVIVISRDHIPTWQSGDPGPPPGEFLLIMPDLSVQSLSCAEIFGTAEGAASPVEAIAVDHPELGRISLFSCAEADFTGLVPAFRVSSRWLPWDNGGPRIEAATETSTVLSRRIPLGWNLPPRPDASSTMLLEGMDATVDSGAGPVLLDQRLGDAIELDTSALGSPVFRALLVDDDTLLLYVPTNWSDEAPSPHAAQLSVTRGTAGWSAATLRRDLEHALVRSGDLLLLANTTQMVQSTLSDFASGMPGALIVSSSCGFFALKPSYR